MCRPILFCVATLSLIAVLITAVESAPCSFNHGTYQVNYGIRAGAVHFRVVLTGIPPRTNGWTAIGFGSGMIDGLDVIVIRLLNGRVIVTDEYVRGYTSPSPDRINNVNVHSSQNMNGMVSVTFSRPVHSSEYPYDSSLLGCQPWKFAMGLNRMGPQGNLFHHLMTPVHRTVCIDQCRI